LAWAPLDLGFEVQACVPYDGGFDPGDWPRYGKRCAGNELLTGSLRAHLWQGQGWQNRYHWLPDNDDLHIAARFEVSINIPEGILIDWEFIVIPPDDIQLYGIKLAFGEFCMNDACTAYEWGAMGAYVLLGYDFGIFYGFDSGLDFIIGSANYVLIDEAGQVFSSADQNVPHWSGSDSSSTTVTVPPGVPSAMFVLGWDPGSTAQDMSLTLHDPNNVSIDENSVLPWVTATVSPTLRGEQTIITVEDPQPGEWQVDITSSSPQLPDYNFAFFANNPAPSLKLSGIPEPSQGPLHPGDVVKIEWTSNVSDTQNSWLSLYYTVTNPITGTQVIAGPIVERLPLTTHGTYEWHVRGLAMIDAFYHVYARIDSNVAAAVNGCGKDHEYNPDPTANVTGCGTMLNPALVLPEAELGDLAQFTYEDWVPPNAPILVGGQPVNWTSVSVQWRPNSDVDLAGYLLGCTQGSLVRTVRTAAEHIAGSTLLELAQVNGLNPNQAATCSVRAYDTSGNISGPSDSTVLWPEPSTDVAIIVPQQGGVVQSPNGQITAEFGAGSVAVTTLVKYTTRPGPPYPVESQLYAGTAFELAAFDVHGEPVTQFTDHFTVTVRYEDDDWRGVGIPSEAQLGIYRWESTAWQPLLPCDGCTHDTADNRFTVLLDSLSEFALLGQAARQNRLCLPLLQVAGMPPEPTSTPTATSAPTVTPTPTDTPTPTETPTPAPVSVSLAPVADAYIQSAVPKANYGTASTLPVGRQSGRSLTRSLLRFDLSLIPPTATVLSARFGAYLVQSSTAPRTLNVELRRVDAAWDEPNVTWASAPDTTGVDNIVAVGMEERYHTWEVATLVQSWVSGDVPNHGLALWSEDEDLPGWRTFASRESFASPPQRPRLEVTYLP
jgi:hypothetical protein